MYVSIEYIYMCACVCISGEYLYIYVCIYAYIYCEQIDPCSGCALVVVGVSAFAV